MAERIVAYTAVFGSFDCLMAAPRFNDVDFVCFTDDSSFRARGWNVVVVEGPVGEARRNSRFFKVLPHRYFADYRFSVWIDGTHCPRRDPRELLAYCGSSGIGLYRHPERDCIYEEAEACVQRGFDEGIIRKQMTRYVAEAYPKRNGLAQTTVMVRKHTSPAVIAAMECWWEEINAGSVRDQLSFDYAMWKLGIRYGCVPGHPYCNDRFYYTPHGSRPRRLRSLLESKRASNDPLWKAVLRAKDWIGRVRDSA